MKLGEALEQVRKLAKGKYHSVGYRIVVFEDSQKKQECDVYVYGYNWHGGDTWEKVILELEKEISDNKPELEEETSNDKLELELEDLQQE